MTRTRVSFRARRHNWYTARGCFPTLNSLWMFSRGASDSCLSFLFRVRIRRTVPGYCKLIEAPNDSAQPSQATLILDLSETNEPLHRQRAAEGKIYC